MKLMPGFHCFECKKLNSYDSHSCSECGAYFGELGATKKKIHTVKYLVGVPLLSLLMIFILSPILGWIGLIISPLVSFSIIIWLHKNYSKSVGLD
jgi:hypothetical protein